jgi:uncharacterized membrane protein
MNHDNDAHHYDTQRIEAFSDGVFAIAITLLVLEIAVPHVGADDDLARSLWDEWPSFFGFGLSFATIGITWMNHHGIFKDVERFDHPTDCAQCPVTHGHLVPAFSHGRARRVPSGR